MTGAILSRRAALGFGAAFALVPARTFAAGFCTKPDATGASLCTAGLQLGTSDTPRQHKPHWCWACCIQTIFGTHGYNVSQEEIVAKIFGEDIDRTANAQEITAAIDGNWKDDRGRGFLAKGVILWDRVDSFERPDALAVAASELQSGNPLIIATEHHVVVLTAMSYHEAQGKVVPQALTVRDPWPYAPNRRALPLGELKTSGLLCAVHVTPAQNEALTADNGD